MVMNRVAVGDADIALVHGWFVTLRVDAEKRLCVVIGNADGGDIVAIGSEDGTGVDGQPYGECFTTDAIEAEHGMAEGYMATLHTPVRL